jgi:hypothetical protein
VIEPRLFLCSGAKVGSNDPVAVGRRPIKVDSIGNKANVNIRFENVAKVFGRDLPTRLVDFLEIAAYVFSADCATRRGKQWTDNASTEPWGRDSAFVIPVRDHSFWASEQITSVIVDLLTFLSNDEYSFSFVPLERDRPYQQQYLEMGDFDDWPFNAPERVLMFSGGLDSLAGAVETAKRGQKSILVSHRPVTTISARQSRLFGELQKAFPGQFIHVPVWINKAEPLGREPTQRTRSFLFAALGCVVGHSINAGGVRFFENGVVSLNLPVADEVLRSRASRTTHPVTIELLRTLCTAVTGRDFVVDNPYFYKTKAEVVRVISDSEVPHLTAQTCSCAHSMFKSKSQLHCGRCSQCIDRRFAVAACGLQAHDPETDYEVDVFIGPRKAGPESNMAVDYVRHALELCQGSEQELAIRFNTEISRAVRYEARCSEAAAKIIAMHKLHGEMVQRVLREKIAERTAELLEGALNQSSLLARVIRQEHLRRLDESAEEQGPQVSKTPSAETVQLERLLAALDAHFAKFGSSRPKRSHVSHRKPQKRDTVIYAAILKELKGAQYCTFLHDRGLRPKWADGGPTTYPQSYQRGASWRKAVQDEKSRAGVRMSRRPNSELAEAFISHLSDLFDELSALLQSRNSRNSRHASKARSLVIQA